MRYKPFQVFLLVSAVCLSHLQLGNHNLVDVERGGKVVGLVLQIQWVEPLKEAVVKALSNVLGTHGISNSTHKILVWASIYRVPVPARQWNDAGRRTLCEMVFTYI